MGGKVGSFCSLVFGGSENSAYALFDGFQHERGVRIVLFSILFDILLDFLQPLVL